MLAFDDNFYKTAILELFSVSDRRFISTALKFTNLQIREITLVLTLNYLSYLSNFT